MDNDKLQEHILSTYLNLRFFIAAAAVLIPLVVYGVGRLHGIGLQDSISAYYWAQGPGEMYPPARAWFVGGLLGVAALLYLYKGFSFEENAALNLAAVLAVGVAVFPMQWNCQEECGRFSLHGFCAVAMFLCLAYVMWFRSLDTLVHLPDERSRAGYRKTYELTSIVMLVSPITAFLMNTFWGTPKSYVFFIETAGILAFALYWVVKSLELRQSGVVRKVLVGQARIPQYSLLERVPKDAPPEVHLPPAAP
ncbi:hypothetical protein D7V97_27580 [Corallococcus sp. CA053C]|uniref:hypothetical protein n=1 Tax=Corallococcus sp. CA053C TaxID=2316732 RepID=UPI000EA18BC3|nr:hypothetical protein [Corallococcus sp. CA053C]RKH02739.1 hypothetical protein D7V97_27580 [Corallococcus sp. CA053C]